MDEPSQNPPVIPPAQPPSEAAPRSPFGLLSQYHHDVALPVLPITNPATGATLGGPRPVRVEMLESAWTSPFSGIRLAFMDFATSLLIFWFSAGLSLAIMVSLVQGSAGGDKSGLPSVAAAFFLAPVYGLYANLTHVVPGIFFFVLECPLLLLTLVATEWGARFKFGLATMVVVALNAWALAPH